MQDLKTKRFFLYSNCACIFFASCILYLASCVLHPASGVALFDDKEKADLQAKIQDLEKKLENVTSDRDNILRQAKNFLTEKQEAVKNLQVVKDSGAKNNMEIDSAKKEGELLKSKLLQMEIAKKNESEGFLKEKKLMQTTISDMEAKINSLANTMSEYSPEKIQILVADRNRLEQENTQMANRLIEAEKNMAEIKRKMVPFELDREELNRLRSDNKEILKRMKYVGELEGRQKQLIQENAENREKVEVLKAKFKESVPGLAKAGRISQKMMRENADMHYNLGTIFLQNRQYREAIKEFEGVLELRPNDPETHYNLGVLYDDYQKDREKALYHYQKYLTINPKAPDAKKIESYILSLELEQKVR